MYFRYPINDVHIHLFDPKDMDECTAMVDECGYFDSEDTADARYEKRRP